MIHIKDTKKVKLNSTERTAVALGKFDGIHQGHMLLIEQVLKLQRQGYMGVVFTFDMRENHVFDVSNMKTIYTSDEKAQVVSDTGVDVLVEYPFDDAFAATEPKAFIRDVLVDMMRADMSWLEAITDSAETERAMWIPSEAMRTSMDIRS